MIFQSLDDKRSCAGFYANGEIFYDEFPDGATKTWHFVPAIGDREVRYGILYCDGKNLEDACPAHLLDAWTAASSRLRAFLRSFRESKIPVDKLCFFDLVPEQFLLEFCYIKNQIVEHVFKTYPEPANYDFLAELYKMTVEIRHQKINLEPTPLKKARGDKRVRAFLRKLERIRPYVHYNVFGTKTGRLTTTQGTFPILTMDKKYRSVLRPNNDYFVEFDVNAAELRTLLALSGQAQPQEDIHEWNVKNVYDGLVTREEAKQRIFAWLYNPNSKDDLASRAHNREAVVKKHFNGSEVITSFDRRIPADDHHALNYIIQSTFNDLFLRRVLKAWELLKDKASTIAFVVHDSVVVDLNKDDKHLIPEIREILRETDLGAFPVNVRAGKDLGSMRRLEWKQ